MCFTYESSFPVQRGHPFNAGYRYIGHRPAGGISAQPVFNFTGCAIADAGLGYTHGRWTFNVRTRNLFGTYAFRLAWSLSRLYPDELREINFSALDKF